MRTTVPTSRANMAILGIALTGYVIAGLPGILQGTLREPFFFLGIFLILVVVLLPGGLAGVTRRVTAREAAPRAFRSSTLNEEAR